MNPESDQLDLLDIQQELENQEIDETDDGKSLFLSNSEKAVRWVLRNNELVSVGLLGIAAAGWYMNHIDVGYPALNNFLFQESGKAAVPVFFGGQLYDRTVSHKKRARGIEEIPRSWSGHTLVFDHSRHLTDSFAKTWPRNKIVYMHDGEDTNNDGTLPGPPFNFKKVRHLNSQGKKYDSDEFYFKEANINYSGGIIINTWNPEDELYSGTDDTKAELKAEEILGILLGITHQCENKKVGIIVPKSMQYNSQPLEKFFSLNQFKKFKSINFYYPETIIENQLAKTISVIEAKEKRQIALRLDSDFPNMKEQLGENLRQRRIHITDDPEEADLNIVDREHDRQVVIECWNQAMMQKDSIGFLERTENIKKIRAFPEEYAKFARPWCLTDLVARTIPLKQMSTYY